MGYPPPQDPYGQSGPQYPPHQQPYGHHSGPQYGYGYQPPTGPPPPPRRSNVGLIVLLAVGLPLLLLGGCAAVVLVLADTGREAVVTESDSVLPSQPAASEDPVREQQAASEDPVQEQQAAPSEEQSAGPSTAEVGGSITLEGRDPGLQMQVSVIKVINPGTPADSFMKPKTGNKFVALEITLTNVGQAVYSDAPTNGAILIDGEGQQYRSTLWDVREGQSFGGTATINMGDSRKGVIVFEVPESATPAKFQFALNSGFADQKGEWTLG